MGQLSSKEQSTIASEIEAQIIANNTAVITLMTEQQNALGGQIATILAPYNEAVVPPTPPDNAYDQTQRYALANNAYKFSENGWIDGQSITNIPAQKGTALTFFGEANPPLEMPYYGKEGIIVMPNTLAVGYGAQLGATPVTRSMWMLIVKPPFPYWEQMVGLYDSLYFGEGDGSYIRTQNSNGGDGTGWQYPNPEVPGQIIMPYNKPIIIRYDVLNTNLKPLVQVYINGIAQGSNMSTNPIKSNVFGFGTYATNCAMYATLEVLDTPLLTAAQNAVIEAELLSEYGSALINPFASNLKITKTTKQTTISYTYSGAIAEDITKRQVKWVKGTDPSTATYDTQYNNMMTIPVAYSGFAEVKVFDTQGNSYSMPQRCVIN